LIKAHPHPPLFFFCSSPFHGILFYRPHTPPIYFLPPHFLAVTYFPLPLTCFAPHPLSSTFPPPSFLPPPFPRPAPFPLTPYFPLPPPLLPAHSFSPPYPTASPAYFSSYLPLHLATFFYSSPLLLAPFTSFSYPSSLYFSYPTQLPPLLTFSSALFSSSFPPTLFASFTSCLPAFFPSLREGIFFFFPLTFIPTFRQLLFFVKLASRTASSFLSLNVLHHSPSCPTAPLFSSFLRGFLFLPVTPPPPPPADPPPPNTRTVFGLDRMGLNPTFSITPTH